MATVEPIIVDIKVIARSLPALPTPHIQRPHLLDAIDMLFEGDFEFIAISGPDGVGKTTLLTEYSLARQPNCVALFVRSASKWSCDLSLIRFDLCNQLSWLLKNKEITDIPDDAFLRSLIHDASRRMTRTQQTLTFIVDGLDELGADSNRIREQVMSMLPFGHPGFRFLVSTSGTKLDELQDRKLTQTPLHVLGFTTDETARLLSDITDDRTLIEEVHRTCKGMPGYLAGIRRLIVSKQLSTDDLLEKLPEKTPGVFELEWKAVESSSEHEQLVLAILAHHRTSIDAQGLARMLGTSADEINGVIDRFSFLEVVSSSNAIGYVSNSFRKFALLRLAALKQKAMEVLIDYLLREPESDAAVDSLPHYLSEAERFDELLGYLSPEHFERLLQRTQSIGPVQVKADIGIETALKLQRDGDLLRFSLQKPTVSSIDGVSTRRAEVKARMALSDKRGAIGVASGALLREDRLHLFAVIGREEKERDGLCSSDITVQIRQLYEQADRRVLRQRVMELAADLLYCAPDLAVDLIERLSPADRKGNALDWAFAALSLIADSNPDDLKRDDNSPERIRSRITDPEVQKFYTTTNVMLGNYSAEDVISEAERTENPNTKLFLLRNWCKRNPANVDALDVVEHAISLAVRHGEYAPDMGLLADLSMPLSRAADLPRIRSLIAVIGSQIEVLERVGATADHIRLLVNLAAAEFQSEFESAKDRFSDTYLACLEVEDIAIQANCLALLLASLTNVDREHLLEDPIKLHSDVHESLTRAMNKLLESTADHYEAASPVISALGSADPACALDIAMQLNTKPRRIAALLDLTDVILDGEDAITAANLPFLEGLITKETSSKLTDNIIASVIERASREHRFESDVEAICLQFISRLGEVSDPTRRTTACCHALNCLSKVHYPAAQFLVQSTEDLLIRSWGSIESEWNKIELGFSIVRSLAVVAPELAAKVLTETEQLQMKSSLDSSNSALTHVGCVQLLIRALGALYQCGLAQPEDLTDVIARIRSIPSVRTRTELLSDLAVRLYLNNRPDEVKRVVSEDIRPNVEPIKVSDPWLHDELLGEAAPALYCAHPPTAVSALRTLQPEMRDSAVFAICEMLLKRTPPSDPFESVSGQKHHIDYQVAIEICDLIQLIESDTLLYSYFDDLASSITPTTGKSAFTDQQRGEVARRLTDIAAEKFPNPDYIRHEGYSVVAAAQVARISRASPDEWDRLAVKARAVPNTADRAFVLALVAVAMPRKDTSKARQILQEARQLIDQIPSVLDRADRLSTLASTSTDLDAQFARSCLDSAMRITVEGKDLELHELQKRIVNVAYRIDQKLASSLASLADDDEARRHIRASIKSHYRVLEMKEAMSKREPATSDNVRRTSELSNAAWRLLGSLNAGRAEPIPFENTRSYIQAASAASFDQAYPIVSWVIENAAKHNARSPHARAIVLPIYQATRLIADLTSRVSTGSPSAQRAIARKLSKDEQSGQVFRASMRRDALEYLESWLRGNLGDGLKIVDPYFGPQDLEFLRLVIGVNPASRVQILTSRQHHEQARIATPWDETYRQHWRIHVSETDPPNTDIYIVGTANGGKLPIHDRWLVTNGAGLALGTSLGALGEGRDSAINVLDHSKALEVEMIMDEYFRRIKREHLGDRLLYSEFSL